MFKRPRLSAQTFPVNAGIAGFLLFYAASCSGPQEPTEAPAEPAETETVATEARPPAPANSLPAVWSTRELDAPVRSIGIAGGAGSTFAVAYDGGGLQIFDFDGDRITEVSDHDVLALSDGRYAMLSGTPVTVFPGIAADGQIKIWIHGGSLAEAIQYDLVSDQSGSAIGLCSSPTSSDAGALSNLAYWTEEAPETLVLASVSQSGDELVLETTGSVASDSPITACTVSGDQATPYSAPIVGAASLERRGRQTSILVDRSGDISLKIGDGDPVEYEILNGITVVVPDEPTALAATGDARGGGYPGGIVVIGGAVAPGDHRVVLVDPSKVTMTAIEVPSASD
ncbi:hypothetical protein [Henriciella litoralis]|uniref:hypothetical protein n=1 Tax=Henriciella litoralis TaxID=568102 RepID=UPI000A01563E|nr:hypothetical protein [Henriciella litoralis]